MSSGAGGGAERGDCAQVPDLWRFLGHRVQWAHTAVVCGGFGVPLDQMHGLLRRAAGLRSCVLYNVVVRDMAALVSNALAVSGEAPKY